MALQHPPLVQRFLDKLSKSRDLSISLIIHAIIIALFAMFVVIKVVPPPKEIEGSFLTKEIQPPKPADPVVPPSAVDPTITTPSSPPTDTMREISAITGGSDQFILPETPVPATGRMQMEPNKDSAVTKITGEQGKIDPALAAEIGKFADWRPDSAGRGGSKKPEFEFTAYIGQYAGGNWNSTVQISNGRIETGSLPNLLYLMSYWTKERVQTNYKNVQAIKLDSDEIFKVKPPFIFMTGTRDFRLTDKEVENLREYIRLGGCIWGDSSVPGERSRFDNAFRREMSRVIGNVDEQFKPLPADHPIFSKGYFSEVKTLPAGLNNYRLPPQAMRYLGEIAILYTANDYGDMWQVGLNGDGKIDLRRDANGHYVAVNRSIFDQRDVYLRNLSPEALASSYKFGANVVMHLLTRWENKLSRSSSTL